jgi:G3E family GTPase
MQILIISGFLGSGKTSILTPFVKRLNDLGKRVAVVENEIGEQGVDDVYLKEKGFYVKEIYHGCICCSLRTNLINCLLELEKEYKPEIVVMEPTGVADPQLLLSSLAEYPGNLDTKVMVSVVDAERFEDIIDLKTAIALDGIKSADLIALNKVDLISPEHLEKLHCRIQTINPEPTIQNVSTNNEKLQEDLFTLIESKLSHAQTEEKQARLVIEKKGILPSVCSKSFEFSKEEICLSELETKKYFEDRVYKIALLLGEARAELIGNVKLIIKSDKDGYLLISTTSFSRFPEVTGALPAGYTTVHFNVNAMVYGIGEELLASIINQVFPH